MKNNRLKLITFVLASIGFIDSIYLLWIKISQNKALCLPGIGDCWSVNTSRYSEIFGIPLSVFGAVAYLAILSLLWLEGRRIPFQQFFPLLIFGITLAGTLFSIYLTYLELFVIHAICPFCVVSAIVMTLLLVVNTIRTRETL